MTTGYSYGFNIINGRMDNKDYDVRMYELPGDKVKHLSYEGMGVVDELKNGIPNLIKGERYTFSNGVTSRNRKVYVVVGYLTNFSGIDVNSVIVKQVEGPMDTIYTLSKVDCEMIGIEFQEGLQLFPLGLKWERVYDVVEFDDKDFSTNPRSLVDNKIRYALVKIEGFEDRHNGYVLSPSGREILEEEFVRTLSVVAKDNIVLGPSGNLIEENSEIRWRIAKPTGLLYKYGNFIAEDNGVYILLLFAKTSRKSCDGFSGIIPDYVKGRPIQDLVKFVWNEGSAKKTKEEAAEYERLKQRASNSANRVSQSVSKIAENDYKEFRPIQARLGKGKIEIPTWAFTESMSPIEKFDLALKRFEEAVKRI